MKDEDKKGNSQTPPPKVDHAFRSLVNQYVESEMPFDQLSKVKQDRLLRAINKDLKRRGFKEKVTRKDMLVRVYWDDLTKVGAEIALSVDVSLKRVAVLMDHKFMPKEVKDSEEYKDFAKEIGEVANELAEHFALTQAMHKDKDGEYLTGEVKGAEEEEVYLNVFEEYTVIGNTLTSWLSENQDKLNRWVISLTSLIKNKIDEVVPPPPVEPLVITDKDIKGLQDESE